MNSAANDAASAGNMPKERQWLPIALVVLVAAVIRGSMLFGTPLIPGMNGGYYLVQARAVFTHGRLGLPDLPLIFYVQAALAQGVRWVSGSDPDSCIIFSVKLTDSVLPALVALPVGLLVGRWAKAGGAPRWIAPAAAATVTLSAPILGMAGNLEKNSLGLLWLCLLLLFIQLWLTHPTLPNAAGVLCSWGLAAVTHIAVFGASMMFGGLSIAFYLVSQRKMGLRALWPLLSAALAVGAIASGIVLWKFDAGRILRLAAALAHPADYLTGSMGPGGRAPLSIPMHAGVSLVFAIASISALLACWRKRAALAPADFCMAGACAAGVLLMTGPWVQGDKAPRFFLIAIAPAVMAAAFALIHCKHGRLRAGLAILGAVCMIGPSVLIVCNAGRPILGDEEVGELRSLAPLIANPGKTLIAARHGMEWWAAWVLHTHIAQVPALRSADWQDFEAIYFLRSKNESRPTPSGGPAPPRDRHPRGSAHSLNPNEEPEIPRDAETVHDGERFILSRVKTPPEFVSGRH